MSNQSGKPMWKHPYPQSTRMDAFRRLVNRKHGLKLNTYDELHNWSVTHLDSFNGELWEFCGITHSNQPDRVADGLEKMWPPPTWFPGARLNFAENLLATGLALHPDAVAITACREGNQAVRHLTWTQLEQQVQAYACALKKSGVKRGDRVGAVSTNSIETVVALLATSWIGGIFSTTAPDMGINGIVERFAQIQPKLIFVESSIRYGGKKHDFRSKLAEAFTRLRKQNGNASYLVDFSGQVFKEHAVQSLSSFLSESRGTAPPEQVPFDHPVYILYSSGTTGPPKCICHAGGRALLQQKKEFMLNSDMGPESSYYQYTTTGWMMWNYLVGALSVGARIVLYDGSPLFPTPEAQLHLVQQQGVTHWGTSPKFLSALKHRDISTFDPSADLKTVIASGSPLSAELCDWFYSWAPAHVGLFSGSGGTDLVGGIVGANPLQPTYPGELARANLGMKVEIFNAKGKNIDQTPGKGDLVITRPFLSMPITFWGDHGMKKYRKAYFEEYPGVWCHGDFIQRNPDTGGYVILGRSDGVLNPGGVRFGSAEIYGVVDKFSEVEDYIAVGQHRNYDNDEHVLLFLKLKTGLTLDDNLRHRIASSIRTLLSPRHVPAHIIVVRDIPYTMNGKRIENLVRDVVNGKPTQVGGTAVNPECLKEYEQYTSLQGSQTLSKL